MKYYEKMLITPPNSGAYHDATATACAIAASESAKCALQGLAVDVIGQPLVELEE